MNYLEIGDIHATFILKGERNGEIFKKALVMISMMLAASVLVSGCNSEVELKPIQNSTLMGMKYFVEVMNTITPSEVAPIFKGRIWVLTSEKVYSALNQEGANSEEYGTEPDITSGEEEESLDTCLKAINKQ